MKLFFPTLLALSCSVVMAAPDDDPDPFPEVMEARAKLTELRWEVIDLRPDDGIAPLAQISGMAWVHARS